MLVFLVAGKMPTTNEEDVIVIYVDESKTAEVEQFLMPYFIVIVAC
jgi:hypothetical protein